MGLLSSTWVFRSSGMIARSMLKLAPLAWLLAAGTAEANDIDVTDAWTPPNAEIVDAGWRSHRQGAAGFFPDPRRMCSADLTAAVMNTG